MTDELTFSTFYPGWSSCYLAVLQHVKVIKITIKKQRRTRVICDILSLCGSLFCLEIIEKDFSSETVEPLLYCHSEGDLIPFNEGKSHSFHCSVTQKLICIVIKSLDQDHSTVWSQHLFWFAYSFICLHQNMSCQILRFWLWCFWLLKCGFAIYFTLYYHLPPKGKSGWLCFVSWTTGQTLMKTAIVIQWINFWNLTNSRWHATAN